MEIDKKKVNASLKNGLNTCNTANNTRNHCHLIWVRKLVFLFQNSTSIFANPEWQTALPFIFLPLFLAVHNSSIGLIVRPLVGPSDQTNNQSLHNTTE